MIRQENEELEFKKSTSELKEGVISLCSMLNKSNHGVLLFGVKNDGTVVGQELGESTLRKISSEIKNHLKPTLTPKIQIKKLDGMDIVSVEVAGTDTPYSAYGRFYKRSADEDNQMSYEELRKCFEEKDITYSTWEKTITPYGEDDVDEELLIDYINKANELNRLNYRYQDVKDALTRLELMEDGHLNNAGFYLFSKRKPLKVKLARFATEDRLTFIDNRIFEGNIFECIEQAIKYAESSINYNSIIKGHERIERPEIPLEALREIITNSFVHMRVSNGDYNEISITPKSVKIYNPGTIALGKDPIDFAKGVINSKLRNPLIALTLYKSENIEAFGTGFRRVFEECAKEGVNYSYREEGLGFAFYFERNQTKMLREYISPNMTMEESFSFLEKEILAYVKELEIIRNVPTLAKSIGKANVTVQKSLTKLVKTGVLERVGARKNGYWRIRHKR